LFRLEKGDIVDVLAISDDNKWDQVRYSGKTGWASAEYLEIIDEVPEEPIPPDDDIDEPDDDIEVRPSVLDDLQSVMQTLSDVENRLADIIRRL
jgi:hypothetical protein